MTIQLFALLVLSRIGSPPSYSCHAFSRPISFRSILSPTAAKSTVERPSCVLSAVVEAIVEEEVLSISDDERGGEAASSSPISATKRYGINSRGAKMNEIDFTLAPTDFSLSRCYQISKSSNGSDKSATVSAQQTLQSLSMSRALNAASNRALRRILLSRSWPSAEALNLSLRTVLSQQQEQQKEGTNAKVDIQQPQEEESDKMKCPVPRPILNILMKRRDEPEETNNEASMSSEEREQKWISNQIAEFRESYSALPGYDQAEAYLESLLCLATSGIESERVAEVMEGGVYSEPYVRLLSVVQSAGGVLEQVEGAESASTAVSTRRRIAKKLIDQDICLSMLDKISLANEKKGISSPSTTGSNAETTPPTLSSDTVVRMEFDADINNQSMSLGEFKEKYTSQNETPDDAGSKSEPLEEPKGAYEKGWKRRLKIWPRGRFFVKGEETSSSIEASDAVPPTTTTTTTATPESSDDSDNHIPPAVVIQPDDLGGVLLSAEEPTMTRQLNVLSHIVQRTLIFGGDQELLLLAETLDADKPAFIVRWYKSNPTENRDMNIETRPGVQYLNALIQLLRDCYTKGVLKDVTPTLPLTAGYQNAYGRLTASLIESGSGYVRPASSSSLSVVATSKYTSPPKSAREGLNRIAKWESTVRSQKSENPYPDDLVGTWTVYDLVGTKSIGSTEVTFKPQGELSVKPPMQGLRWRLDPGPTHLDTCTFQVLSDDGAILQYKGFVDRGARLEARVSKRSVSLRGGISFLMRDAEGMNTDNDYWDDMVPMNYLSGTTKFVMSRNVTNEIDQSSTFITMLQTSLRCPPIAEGERKILNGRNGPILVTRVAGSYYAVDATCPHLNLPMKKGKIGVAESGQPTLTCSFHNSCFELKTGKCTKWVTGALGTQNELISGIMSSVGSEQKDIVAYNVFEEEDGSLTVRSEAHTTSNAES